MSDHKPVVVKIGGNALGPEDTTFQDVVALREEGIPVVVVHGGGPLITQWLQSMGIRSAFVRGLRVTDEASLEVVTAVLCGLVNKRIVAAIRAAGGRAIGISGVDAGTVTAEVCAPELGLVGEVKRVDPGALEVLLEHGYIPVVAPVSASPDPKTPLLNVNADTVAGAIAGAIGAERLVFLTDVPGVQDRDGRVIAELTPAKVQELVESGVITGGMIPKIEACVQAVSYVSTAQIADGRRPGALRKALANDVGTRVRSTG